MLSPRRSIAETATERTALTSALTGLQTAIITYEWLFTGATPPLTIPPQLWDIHTAINSAITEVNALTWATYTPDGIRACRNHIRELIKLVKNSELSMNPYVAEYRHDVVSVAEDLKNHNNILMSQALGNKVRRNIARINNSAPVQAMARHKGKIAGTVAGAAGAGAILYGVLHMDGFSHSSSGQLPPTGNTPSAPAQHIPVDKQWDTTKQGKNYDREGKKFSVGGFLNASKTVFPNGASPSAQAFQGVWNFIAENCKDEKTGFGEQYHFHTTPDTKSGDLTTTTHYDVNAYTAPHSAKVIEITWQMENAKEKKGGKIEALKEHTWKFTLNSNGTILKTNVYHDGRWETSIGTVSKLQFQEDLARIQWF